MGRLFGDYLRQLRRAKGISQENLSRMVDYKRTNISGIENGRQKPSDELLIRIADVLETPFVELKAVKIVDSLSRAEEYALLCLLNERKFSQNEPVD